MKFLKIESQVIFEVETFGADYRKETIVEADERLR